jgi:ParB family chromosome partitioning protein
MEVKDIKIEELELGDERFRISYFSSLDPFIRSIREIGLVNLPLVTERNGRFVPVCGWKRILACREISFSSLPVLLLQEKDDLKVFRIVVFENLTSRSFSLLEKAEIFHKLAGFGEEEKTLVKFYLPLLNVPATYDYYDLFLKVSSLGMKEKERIQKKSVSLPVIRELVEFVSDEREALYPLFLPLSQNKQKEVLEIVKELSLKSGLSVPWILEDKEFQIVIRSINLTPLHKAERIRQLLRKRRFPQLTSRQEDFASAKRRMAWPEDIQVSPAPFFEEKKMFVRFSFLSKQDYIEKLSVLRELADQKDFEIFFERFPDE